MSQSFGETVVDVSLMLPPCRTPAEKVANEASDDEVITVWTFVSSLLLLPLHHKRDGADISPIG